MPCNVARYANYAEKQKIICMITQTVYFSTVMQITISQQIAPRSTAKALRFFAQQAEMVMASPDADPSLKAALAALQADFELTAATLEQPTPPADAVPAAAVPAAAPAPAIAA